MENKTTELDLTKFPTLEYLKQDIEKDKQHIDLLNKRMKFLGDNTENTKSDYDQNENAILIIETDRKLAKLHRNVKGKEEKFKSHTEDFLHDIDEVNEKFDEMLQKITDKAPHKKECAELLKEIERIGGREFFETNWQAKQSYYRGMKAWSRQLPKPGPKKHR